MKKTIIIIGLSALLVNCADGPSSENTEHKKVPEKQSVQQEDKVEDITDGTPAFEVLPYSEPEVISSTASREEAENIPSGSHLTQVAFEVNEDFECYVMYKLDGIANSFKLESEPENPWNTWADFKFMDLSGDGVEEIIVNWSSEDATNGFESGFEMYEEGMIIINPVKSVCVMDVLTAYQYMSYADMGEEDDTHGKMDEDSEFEQCDFASEITWNSDQTFEIRIKDYSFEPIESTGNAVANICHLDILEGSYSYNTNFDHLEMSSSKP